MKDGIGTALCKYLKCGIIAVLAVIVLAACSSAGAVAGINAEKAVSERTETETTTEAIMASPDTSPSGGSCPASTAGIPTPDEISPYETSAYTSAPGTSRPEDNRKVAYLTFDDGPSRKNTPKNLDTLAQYGIKATFFVLPHEKVDDIYKRIIDEGHVLGNHSYSHDYKQVYSSADDFLWDLLRAGVFLQYNFNYTSVLYRFPGGTFGKKPEMLADLKKVLEEEGYRYFDWTVSDGDCDTGPKGKDPEVLTKNVLDGARGRKKVIVLMHDSADKTYTAEALPMIIEGLKKRGFEFDVLTNY